MGCANRHVEKETLIKVYLMVWNALVENRADFMEQWTEQLQSENLLEGYRAEKFIEYTDGAEPLTQMDTDFMLKTLAAQIKQYKKSTILTPIFAALEVVMEVLIPMAMACLVKYGILGGDTGAIYRTVGYHMWLMGIGPRDADGIRRCLDDVNIEIQHQDDGVQHMILNGKDVTGEIRTPEMSKYASGVSARKCVRDFLLDMQRAFARKHNVVMDGRDIGTVVLPKAQVKIFLTASPEERAKRRFEELTEKGEKASYEKVLQDMKQRDKQDSERAIAPLKPAPDAVKLDTSGNTIEQSVSEILAIVRLSLIHI